MSATSSGAVSGLAPAEAIYKGATRPAMLMGIPLVPLVLMCGLAALLVLWLGLIVNGWLALVVVAGLVPALLWMRWVTHHDDQRLRQMFVLSRLWLADRNQRFWQARSYAPTLYRRSRDAWRP